MKPQQRNENERRWENRPARKRVNQDLRELAKDLNSGLEPEKAEPDFQARFRSSQHLG